jgi:hypothetical protein
MDAVKRKKEFNEGAPVPTQIVDSRFGIRNMILNNERSSVAGYQNPGRGQNGEHQN